MNEQSNVDIVRRGYDAFSSGDINALLALFDDQITWTTPGPPELPTSGRRRGKTEVAGFFGTLNEVLEIQRFEPAQFIAQGDQVVVTGTDTARVRATGKILDADWAHVFTIRNGKVVAFHEFMDTSALVAELRTAQQRT